MNNTMLTNKDFILSVLENSYDGIYITDKNSVTIYVNKAYENLTGHKRSEYVGKHMDDLIKAGIMKVHITRDVIASKKSVTTREELISGKNVLVTGNPIFNNNNEIIAVVTNVRDISEIISLEKKGTTGQGSDFTRYQKQFFDASAMRNIVCESGANTISVFNFCCKGCSKDSTVLLNGETGVGKEVVAKYIHYNSLRKKIATTLRSTVALSRKIFWNPNCSDMSAVLLQERIPTASLVYLNLPITEHYSLMKSENCL